MYIRRLGFGFKKAVGYLLVYRVKLVQRNKL